MAQLLLQPSSGTCLAMAACRVGTSQGTEPPGWLHMGGSWPCTEWWKSITGHSRLPAIISNVTNDPCGQCYFKKSTWHGNTFCYFVFSSDCTFTADPATCGVPGVTKDVLKFLMGFKFMMIISSLPVRLGRGATWHRMPHKVTITSQLTRVISLSSK